MGFRVVDHQEQKVRLTLPTRDGNVVVVYDDPELIEHDDYAPGVFHDMKRAWLARDYFYVELRNAERSLDGIGQMAGYGGPRKAAEAAARDHFGVELQGIGGKPPRRARQQSSRRGRASKKRTTPKRRAAAKHRATKRRRRG